jgi:hypothetical protein
LLTNRNQTNAPCAEIQPNPRVVGSNFLVSGLTLADLLNAQSGANQIVTCDSSGLQGTPYEIYAFRQAPGGSDVDPSTYGIATFDVDVEAPAIPNVNTTPQRQTNFNISWSNPDPPDKIQLWTFYVSDTDDPSTAVQLDGITASQSDLSKTISAQQLGLSLGESAYVFVAAYDQAFVSVANVVEQANLGDLSSPVPVTYVEVGGFCDATGDCSGCSVSPMILPNGQPSQGLFLAGLLLAVLGVWRLRR